MQQLRAGRLAWRLPQLAIGLFLFGFALAMMIEAALGLPPWDVLHQGLTHYLPLSIGVVAILTGLLLLLSWIPLRQWPGLGTICNAVLVGVAMNIGLWILPTPEALPVRIAFVVGGIVLNGFGAAVYLGAQFGPGPRDGLMTGLVRLTGRPIWMVRTSIEAVVVIIGFLLGGNLWIGTIAYAVSIGPVMQFFLPLVTVALPDAERTRAEAVVSEADEPA